MTTQELINRAAELRAKTAPESITAELLGGLLQDMCEQLEQVERQDAQLPSNIMRTIIEVAGVDYTTTAAPMNSTQTAGLPLYWLARPAAFAVKRGTTYYTMPSTDERFAACGLRRVGQLFKCGGETFYLDESLNPVFVNSAVRFDRSGSTVKTYPSNSTLKSLYEAAGAAWNEDTGYYELNGVNDIDEEEMAGIYDYKTKTLGGRYKYSKYTGRTICLPTSCDTLTTTFHACTAIVVIPRVPIIGKADINSSYAYSGATSLRITSVAHYGLTQATYLYNSCSGAAELVQVQLASAKAAFSLSDSPRISYYSLNYLATNAANTAAITVTLPTPQATIINTILGADAGEVADLLPEEQNFIFQQLAQMPWEAKLKVEYTQPIWREDNGSTIAFTNRMPQLDEAGETYTFQDVAYNDVRPSLIKHEKGANGEYIYAAWYDYVNKMLASDRHEVGTELVQYTTALNTYLAVSIYDWIDLANKFGAKGITIADGAAAAASATEE